MQKTEDFEIEGIKYRITEILATDRMILGAKLNAYNGGITGVSSGQSSQDQVEVTKLSLDKGMVIPKFSNDSDFEAHFSDYYHHIPELMDRIYKLNFGRFEEELKKKYS